MVMCLLLTALHQGASPAPLHSIDMVRINNDTNGQSRNESANVQQNYLIADKIGLIS